MRNVTGTYQRGMTLTGLLFAGVVILLLVILGMKVVPEVLEYRNIVSAVDAIATDPIMAQSSNEEIRTAFQKRALINQITSIKAVDLEITPGNGGARIAFAYRKEIPLFEPVSLVIDFKHATR
jgi:hypothetical protein